MVYIRDGSLFNFTWQNGRQLASGTKGTTEFAYTYNADGLRTKKVVGNTTTTYYWAGTQLVAMTVDDGTTPKTLKFYYDAEGRPFCFDLDGEIYFYIMNLQGDVMQIVFESGSVYGWYEYDAWGKLLTLDGNSSSIAEALSLNPLRYRGYIYDSETEFYYLQSRYYDPAVGRFINADTMIDSGAGFLGNNLYIYVANNPINASDPNGHWIIKDAIKSVVQVMKPIVDFSQKLMSNINATYSKGLSISASEIVNVGFQPVVSVDIKGTIALQCSIALGAGSEVSSVSINAVETRTNAPSIESLEGYGYQFGGSANVPIPETPIAVCAGGDINVIPVYGSSKNYYGVTEFVGVSNLTPSVVEAHAQMTQTFTVCKVNVFQLFEDFYDKVMEW